VFFFERNWADYYGFVSKNIKIDNDNHSRTRTHGRTRAQNQKEKANGPKIRTTLILNTIPLRIKRNALRKEPGRAKEICDVRYGTYRTKAPEFVVSG
jgi:hypothetical protein